MFFLFIFLYFCWASWTNIVCYNWLGWDGGTGVTFSIYSVSLSSPKPFFLNSDDGFGFLQIMY